MRVKPGFYIEEYEELPCVVLSLGYTGGFVIIDSWYEFEYAAELIQRGTAIWPITEDHNPFGTFLLPLEYAI